jgi:dTDP-L-rhamnose 4-epimerase
MFASDHHIDVNVRGTAVLMRALREEGVAPARMVLSSSRAVYGEGANRCDSCGTTINPGPRRVEDLAAGVWAHRCPACGGPLRAVPTPEDLPARYCSVYGMTKLFQEQVSQAEAAQLGVDLVILRYFNVYGPRQSLDNPYTGLINTLALRLLAGKDLVLYEEGTPVRDFVHVEDVVAATVQAALGPVPDPGEVNVGSGRAIPLLELAADLARALGRGARVTPSPRFRLGDIHAAVADVSRAERALGWAPAISLTEGLASLVPGLETAQASDRSDEVEQEMRRHGVLRG